MIVLEELKNTVDSRRVSHQVASAAVAGPAPKSGHVRQLGASDSAILRSALECPPVPGSALQKAAARYRQTRA